MKKILLVLMVIGLFSLAACAEPIENSSWTVIDKKEDYLEEHDSLDAVIKIYKDKAKITQYSLVWGEDGIKDVEKPLKQSKDTLVIGKTKYKYDKDTLTTDGLKYVRDYGVRFRSFYLDKAYFKGDNSLIYDSHKRNGAEYMDFDINGMYTFDLNDGMYKDTEETKQFTAKFKDSTDWSLIKIKYSNGKKEQAKYDKKENTLTFEGGDIRRVYSPMKSIKGFHSLYFK